jgi:hypothetical protein
MTADVDSLGASERFSELAEILAAAVVRRQARKSSGISAGIGESSLDFSGQQSGHPTPSMAGETDG